MASAAGRGADWLCAALTLCAACPTGLPSHCIATKNRPMRATLTSPSSHAAVSVSNALPPPPPPSAPPASDDCHSSLAASLYVWYTDDRRADSSLAACSSPPTHSTLPSKLSRQQTRTPAVTVDDRTRSHALQSTNSTGEGAADADIEADVCEQQSDAATAEPPAATVVILTGTGLVVVALVG